MSASLLITAFCSITTIPSDVLGNAQLATHEPQHSVTFATKEAYIRTPFEQHYFNSTFSLNLQVKTGIREGLILYWGSEKHDRHFFAVELFQSRVRFIYNMAGPWAEELEIGRPSYGFVGDNQWHNISIERPTMSQMILRVDEGVKSAALHRNWHFDAHEMMYVGGVGEDMWGKLPRDVWTKQTRLGFKGCVGAFEVVDKHHTHIGHGLPPDTYMEDIAQGCSTDVPEIICKDRFETKVGVSFVGRCLITHNSLVGSTFTSLVGNTDPSLRYSVDVLAVDSATDTKLIGLMISPVRDGHFGEYKVDVYYESGAKAAEYKFTLINLNAVTRE